MLLEHDGNGVSLSTRVKRRKGSWGSEKNCSYTMSNQKTCCPRKIQHPGALLLSRNLLHQVETMISGLTPSFLPVDIKSVFKSIFSQIHFPPGFVPQIPDSSAVPNLRACYGERGGLRKTRL